MNKKCLFLYPLLILLCPLLIVSLILLKKNKEPSVKYRDVIRENSDWIYITI